MSFFVNATEETNNSRSPDSVLILACENMGLFSMVARLPTAVTATILSLVRGAIFLL